MSVLCAIFFALCVSSSGVPSLPPILKEHATINITIGAILTYTGSWKNFAEGTLTNLQFWHTYLESPNVLPNFNIFFVGVDVQKDKDLAEQAAYGLIHGNYSGELLVGNLMSSVDVLFAPYSTSRTERVAQMTELYGIPLLGTTSTDKQLYKMNSDGVRPFSTYSWGHTIAINQYTNLIQSLYILGARSVTLVYDGTEGFDVNEIEGVRRAANDLGMEIKGDYGWVNQGTGYEMENLGGGDVLVAAFYTGNGICERLIKYLHDNDINYNAIVLAICSGHDFYTDVREKAAYVLDSVLWNPKMSGSLFEDGSFSSWQRFEKSSNYTVEFYRERGRVPDYRDASSMAAIYRLHSALVNGGTEWSNFLEGHLEPSFYGLIGCDEVTSYNPHATVVSVQFCRKKDCLNYEQNKKQVVLPFESAEQAIVYPMPKWSERECYPECVECELCETLFKLSTTVLWSTFVFCLATILLTYLFFTKFHQEEKTMEQCRREGIMYWPSLSLLIYSTFMEIISLINYIAFRKSLGFAMWKIIAVGISVGMSVIVRFLDIGAFLQKIFVFSANGLLWEVYFTTETIKKEWEFQKRQHSREMLGSKNIIYSAAGQLPIFFFNLVLLMTSDVTMKSAMSIVISVVLTSFCLGQTAVAYQSIEEQEEMSALIQYCTKDSRLSIRPADLEYYRKHKKFIKKHGDEAREVREKFKDLVHLASPKKGPKASCDNPEPNVKALKISIPDPNALPLGWEEKFDPKTDRHYYVNHKTKTTSWDDPRKAPPTFSPL